MGACCAAVRITSEDAAERTYTDLQLLTRRQTSTLPQENCEALILEAQENSFLRYFQKAEKVLDSAPISDQCLQTRLSQEVKYSLSAFKYSFREGSVGVNVTFHQIKAAEQELIKRLSEVTAAAQFVNRQRSYEHCTEVAAELMRQYQAKQKSLPKVLGTYKSLATGPFAILCGEHLQELLQTLDQHGEIGMLALRKHQLHKELRLVNDFRSHALERCSAQNLQSLAMCSRKGSHDTRATTFLEFIDRIPSVESGSFVSSCQDTQQAEIVMQGDADPQAKTLY